MLKLVILACLASGPCKGPERADVHAESFAHPIACQLAWTMSLADWQAKNPGWKVVASKCVPQNRLQAFLDKELGYDA